MTRYWRRLRSSKHPVRVIVSKLLLETGLCRFFYIQQEGFVLRFYPTNQSKILWVDASHNPHNAGDERSFFRRYLRRGDVVLDVGANIGLTSLTAAHLVGPAGEVFAIEPHPKIYRFLKGNVSVNNKRNVHLYNLALGNSSGTIGFSNSPSDDLNSVTSRPGAFEVPIVRLDDLKIERPISLLKIDVEGYEKFVLEGATATLPFVDCIYFESWADHFAKFGYTCSDVFQILLAAGFRLLRPVGPDRVEQVNSGHTSSTRENLIAARDVYHLCERTGLDEVS